MQLPAFASLALVAITNHLPHHTTDLASSSSLTALAPATTTLTAQSSFNTTVSLQPFDLPPEPTVNLELREVVQGGATTLAAAQYPTITTEWVQTSLPGGGFTYVPLVYTQTFPSIYELFPSPASGEIGLGTISGSVGVVRTSTPKWSNASGRRPPALMVIEALAVGMGATISCFV
jgi:hypothetical protein